MTPAAVGLPMVEGRAGGRLGWRTVVVGAFVVTLVRPVSWLLGLAGFLAGGGLLLVGLPVAVLPTPTGVQNALGGPVSTLVVGTPSSALVLLIALGAAGALALVVAGTVVGAWAERQGILVALDGAADEGLAPALDEARAPGVGGVAAIRLLSLLPVAVAVLLAWQPVYDAAYHQLVLPDELATPLPLRVVRDVPALLAVVALTWLLSDAAAAVGVRRHVMERRPALSAWLLGWTDLARRPVRFLGTAVLGLGVLTLLIVPPMLAASAGWWRVREVAQDGTDPVAMAGAVVIWVAIWLGGLVLAGVGAAFRAAAWTLAAILREQAGGEHAP